MKTSLKILSIVLLSYGLISCEGYKKETTTMSQEGTKTSIEKPIQSILTAEEQAGMTPDEIIGRLKKGMRIL